MCYILWWRTYKPLKQKFPFSPDLIYLSKNFQTINRLIDSSKKVVFISSGINFRSRVLDTHSTVGAWQKKKKRVIYEKKIKLKYRYLSEIVIAQKLKVRTSRCIFFFVGEINFYE